MYRISGRTQQLNWYVLPVFVLLLGPVRIKARRSDLLAIRGNK